MSSNNTFEVRFEDEVILTAVISEDGKGFTYMVKEEDANAVMLLRDIIYDMISDIESK